MLFLHSSTALRCPLSADYQWKRNTENKKGMRSSCIQRDHLQRIFRNVLLWFQFLCPASWWSKIMGVIFYTVTYSGFCIHDGPLLHSKTQYTTVQHSRKLLEHTYTSDLYGTVTLIPIEFFHQDLLWQSSNTHSHSCSHKASKHTSRQSVVGLSVHLHTTTAPRPIVHH
jgi:hypothetical protein